MGLQHPPALWGRPMPLPDPTDLPANLPATVTPDPSRRLLLLGVLAAPSVALWPTAAHAQSAWLTGGM